MTDQWQDISTAPRDGSRVLLSNGKYVHIGRWCEAPIWERDDFPHWCAWECDEDFFYSFHLIDTMEPTHWMPLPAPPSDAP